MYLEPSQLCLSRSTLSYKTHELPLRSWLGAVLGRRRVMSVAPFTAGVCVVPLPFRASSSFLVPLLLAFPATTTASC
ncbi:hypothetical protein E2C01_017151 [Portunus trituberculatus]|uniref:Uncharacterized protein n=1 Tax=Portunus trituberculatus TaxID=210409 RepID=A0A5B7DRK0_PORTR|nr:hypothetical protein [Portunus trituberculatus]